MAELVFSSEDLAEVERICSELDPEKHELTASTLASIEDPDDRQFILDYFNRCLRDELLAGIAARAMGDALIRNEVADPGAVRGWINEDFWERYDDATGLRRSVLQHNLGRVGGWNLRAWSILNPVKGGLALPVPVQDLAARQFCHWLDLANERMFGTGDEMLASMLEWGD